MASPDLSKLVDNVASLNQDMAKVGTLVDRLDITIIKLADISANVSQLLAVHESKLTAQEILTKQTVDLIEKRRVETDEKIQLVHGRISSGEKELTEKIDNQYDDIMNELKDMRKESTEQHNKLSGRITTMEKWMWTVMGGAIVIGSIIGFISNHI